MKETRQEHMIEELLDMPPGSRLVKYRGGTFLLAPGETVGEGTFEEWLVKSEDGSLVSAWTGEIMSPPEDE
jgi:hypothetical protein